MDTHLSKSVYGMHTVLIRCPKLNLTLTLVENHLVLN